MNTLDERIFEIINKLYDENEWSIGNSSHKLIKTVEQSIPILQELYKQDDIEKYFTNAGIIVEVISNIANEHLKVAVNEGKINLLLIDIEGTKQGNNLISEYKYLFYELLSKIQINKESQEKFAIELDFFSKNFLNLSASKHEKGCYVATMAYGDYDHPQVMILRQFRDDVLDKSAFGKWFVKTYYNYSPKLVERLKNQRTVNIIIRKALNQFIKLIK